MPRRGERTDRDPTAVAFGAAVREVRGERTLNEVAHYIPGMDPKYLGEIELGCLEARQHIGEGPTRVAERLPCIEVRR